MSESHISLRTVIIWTVIPFMNFIIWYYMGLYQRGCPVPYSPLSSAMHGSSGDFGSNKVVYNYSICDSYGHMSTSSSPSSAVAAMHSHLPPFISANMADSYHFGKLKMEKFEKYKKDRLVHLKSASASVIELNFHKQQGKQQHKQQPCTRYVHVLVEAKPDRCVAVVASTSNPGSLNLLRFNKDSKKTGRVLDKLHPAPSGRTLPAYLLELLLPWVDISNVGAWLLCCMPLSLSCADTITLRHSSTHHTALTLPTRHLPQRGEQEGAPQPARLHRALPAEPARGGGADLGHDAQAWAGAWQRRDAHGHQ